MKQNNINAGQYLADMLHPIVLCSDTGTVTSAHLLGSGVLRQADLSLARNQQKILFYEFVYFSICRKVTAVGG